MYRSKKGLKTRLHEVIKSQGSITYSELETLCHQWGYKVATAERALRRSQSPQIERIKKNGSIVAYRWFNAIQTNFDTAEAFLAEWGKKEENELEQHKQRDLFSWG